MAIGVFCAQLIEVEIGHQARGLKQISLNFDMLLQMPIMVWH